MRMSKYPVQLDVDAAFTVAISSFFDKSAELSETAARILGELPFLRPVSEQMVQTGDNGGVLHLPLLLVNHQPEGQARNPQKLTRAARREQEIALSSAAWFLEVFGITDFPVYGLVTVGQNAYLQQAWCSAEDKVCSPFFISAETGCNIATMLVLLYHGLQYPEEQVQHRYA